MLVFVYRWKCQSRSSTRKSSSRFSIRFSFVLEGHFSYCEFFQSEIFVPRWNDAISEVHQSKTLVSPLVYQVNRSCFVFLFRQRLPTRNVFYYRCPDHRKNYVMSFTFCFDREDDVYQFAYSFPYSYTKLQNYLDHLERRQLDYLQRHPLVYSVVNRNVWNEFRMMCTFFCLAKTSIGFVDCC